MVSPKLMIFACLIVAGSCIEIKLEVSVWDNFLNRILDLDWCNKGDVVYKTPKSLDDEAKQIADIGVWVGGILVKVKTNVNLHILGNLIQKLVSANLILGLCTQSVGRRCSYCTRRYRGRGPWIGYGRRQIIQAFGLSDCKSRLQKYSDQYNARLSGSEKVILRVAIDLANILVTANLDATVSLLHYKKTTINVFLMLGAVYHSYTNGNTDQCRRLVGGLASECSKYMKKENLGEITDKDLATIIVKVKIENDKAPWSNKCTKDCKPK